MAECAGGIERCGLLTVSNAPLLSFKRVQSLLGLRGCAARQSSKIKTASRNIINS